MKQNIWYIYFACTKDNMGWMRVFHTKTRKEAREYVKEAKQEDINAEYPYFKYRIVKEQV